MTPTLTIQELAIVITAKNQNSTLLTPDFLFGTGIVSKDWELAREPILTPQVAQVTFTNGINIVAQYGTITFLESLGTQAIESVKIPALARKYVETLPHLDYQAVSINPRSFVTFGDSDEDAARNYIVTTLMSPGSWQGVGSEPVRASVNLAYTVNSRQLNLSVSEARLQFPEQPPLSAVLFSGNFTYNIIGDTESERRQHLYQLIEYWREDLETYREIVNSRFLGKEEELPLPLLHDNFVNGEGSQ